MPNGQRWPPRLWGVMNSVSDWWVGQRCPFGIIPNDGPPGHRDEARRPLLWIAPCFSRQQFFIVMHTGNTTPAICRQYAERTTLGRLAIWFNLIHVVTLWTAPKLLFQHRGAQDAVALRRFIWQVKGFVRSFTAFRAWGIQLNGKGSRPRKSNTLKRPPKNDPLKEIP